MTDEERYIAQGRARDAVKKWKSEVATLRTWFDEYRQTLVNMEHLMGHWLQTPSGKSPDDRLMADHLNQLQRELSRPGFFDKTSELMDAARKLKNAEEQIKDF